MAEYFLEEALGITTTSLTKTYGGKAGITDINLELPDGALTAVVGPSGCGKTTLLRTLAGLLFPDSGTIHFGQREVTRTSPQKRKASMVFQQYALWPHLSVFSNVAYGLKVQGKPKGERAEEVLDVLRRVEIDTADIRKRHPQEYSGGQQQRIALARALVTRPEVLLLDEPLSNLDAKVRQRLRVEIREIQQSFGITAVYVTHDQEEALSMADYVVLMNEGRVIQADAPESLYERPTSLFAAQFVGDSATLEIQNNGTTDRLVVRADQVLVEPSSESSTQELREGADGLSFTAEVVGSVYMGSYFRYMVEFLGQRLFVNDDRKLDASYLQVHIPHDKVHRFSDVSRGVLEPSEA